MLSAGYINALAKIFRISRSYIDLYGTTRKADNNQIINVLKTIGITNLETDEDVRKVIQSVKEERYKNCLERVRVVYEKAADKLKIHFYIEESEIPEIIFWKLTFENGETEVGELKTRELRVRGVRNISRGSSNVRYVKFEFILNKHLPLGYHRFELKITGAFDQLIIVAPNQAYIPTSKPKYNGLNAQIYSLRSQNNWGIGEFSDLKPLIDALVLQDGDFLGLSPIHALSVNNLGAYSPYSPCSRQFLNVFNLDIEEIIKYQNCDEVFVKTRPVQMRINALRESELIDYQGVKALKLEVLKKLYENFLTEHIARNTKQSDEFGQFAGGLGTQLERYALYEALCEHFLKTNPNAYGWMNWGQEYQSPDSPAVQQFVFTHREEIDFYKYLQWHADRQLRDVANYAKQKKLEIGFYIDCAISAEKNSAEVWANHKFYATSASIGCPPDAYAPQGQNWGFAPPRPYEMAQEQCRNFIETLRSNMKYAGAIRIDHALSLYRLFWIPDGDDASQGLYIHYPFEDLLGILCLESVRHKCVVVGEDLGTVPEGFREKMEERGILSYKVFFFMKKWDDNFESAGAYNRLSFATGTTHDMMTLWGYWKELDLDERLKIGLLDEAGFEREKEVRRREKRALVDLLKGEGWLEEDVQCEGEMVAEGCSDVADGGSANDAHGLHGADEADEDVVDAGLPLDIFYAIQNFLLSTPSLLNSIPLEDLVGQEAQVNIPGVVDEYPCWKHKIPVSVEEVLESAKEE